MESSSRVIAFDCSSCRLHGRPSRACCPTHGNRARRLRRGHGVWHPKTSSSTSPPAPPCGSTLPPAVQGGATTTKLPIVVFFHGGYFVVGAAGEPMYYRYVNSLVARARVVAVSVDYRLAPEHPLPAAYDDSWAALKWAVSGADTWLPDHGDLGRVFLVGVSAGDNIAHNMAVSVGVSGLPAAAEPPRIEGVILLQPSFSSEQKMEVEEGEFYRANNNRWAVIFPGPTGGADDPRINPMAAGAPSLEKVVGERLLVCTASLEFGPESGEGAGILRGRAGQRVAREGGVVETEGEDHGFFVLNPAATKVE